MTSPSCLIAGVIPGSTWTLDPKRSTLTFAAKTFWGAYTIKGAFTEIVGSGQVSKDHHVTGRLTARTESLSTAISLCDEHLRSNKFFDVEHHPDIVVEVHGVKPTRGDRLELDATIAVKGVVHQLFLSATVGLMADGATWIATRANINRCEFGVDGNLAGMIPETTHVKGVAVFAPQVAAAP